MHESEMGLLREWDTGDCDIDGPNFLEETKPGRPATRRFTPLQIFLVVANLVVCGFMVAGLSVVVSRQAADAGNICMDAECIKLAGAVLQVRCPTCGIGRCSPGAARCGWPPHRSEGYARNPRPWYRSLAGRN